MKAWTCRCGQRNTEETCKQCESPQPKRRMLSEALKPRRCLYDGTQLDERGWCLAGNGYPDYLRCPFVCPHCREPLRWSGACYHCTPVVRAYPGVRLDTHDDDGQPLGDGQHWVKTAEAGGATATPAEVRAAMAEIQRRLKDSTIMQKVVPVEPGGGEA